MPLVRGFLCSGAQFGEFAPMKLILLYSIYSLHLCLLIYLEDFGCTEFIHSTTEYTWDSFAIFLCC